MLAVRTYAPLVHVVSREIALDAGVRAHVVHEEIAGDVLKPQVSRRHRHAENRAVVSQDPLTGLWHPVRRTLHILFRHSCPRSMRPT